MGKQASFSLYGESQGIKQCPLTPCPVQTYSFWATRFALLTAGPTLANFDTYSWVGAEHPPVTRMDRFTAKL